MANRRDKVETLTDFILGGSKSIADSDCSHEIKRCLILGRKVMTNLENRDIALLIKVHTVKAMVFLVVMYGCERRLSIKELMLLNCSVGKDSWESLDCKERDQTSNPKGNQLWILTGRTDANAETSVLWPKSWPTGKDPDAGKAWKQKKQAAGSCPLSRWCHPIISSSVTLNLSQHQGLFQWDSCSPQVAKVSELQLNAVSFSLEFYKPTHSLFALYPIFIFTPTWKHTSHPHHLYISWRGTTGLVQEAYTSG